MQLLLDGFGQAGLDVASVLGGDGLNQHDPAFLIGNGIMENSLRHDMEIARRQIHVAVLELNAIDSGSVGRTISIGFRSSVLRKKDLPLISGPKLTLGGWQSVDLDGRALFAKSGLIFRRWDSVRFLGALKLKAVALK